MSEKESKIRLVPRISATKLGEYTVASPHRRRTIVHDQREPRNFIVTRYERARDALGRFFTGGAVDPSLVAEVAMELSTIVAPSDWQAQDNQTSSEALEKFLDICDEFDLEGLVAVAGTNNAPTLDIADVEVSVRPDVILRGTYHGKKVVGALKFHFAKTSPLVQDASANVAVLLQRYCETHVREDGETVSARHCAVLDVFSQKWARSPRATQLRLRTIEAACREIRLWWAAA